MNCCDEKSTTSRLQVKYKHTKIIKEGHNIHMYGILGSSGKEKDLECNTFQVRSACYVKLSHITHGH